LVSPSSSIIILKGANCLIFGFGSGAVGSAEGSRENKEASDFGISSGGLFDKIDEELDSPCSLS
jgi:hypothetical protein